MQIKYLIFSLPLFFMLFNCTEEKVYQSFDPIDHVDPFIGTHNGATNPGATTPWGMVTVTPQYSEIDPAPQETPHSCQPGGDFIYGFSHTALSGVCHESAGVVLMPVFGDMRWRPEDRKSRYSLEFASPGYYKVKLDDGLMFAEMTATTRSGLSRFYFQDGWAHIVLDLSASRTPHQDDFVRITAPNEIEGYKYENLLRGARPRKVYFVAQFDRTAMGGGVYKGNTLYPDTVSQARGKEIGVVFSFRTRDASTIHVKVGISYVSMENARLNLQTEQPKWEFALIRQRAREQWQKELSKIMVYGGSEKHTKMFYTALYHSLLTPHIFQDVNGDYPRMDGAVGTVEGMNRYSVFSLWDAFRTLHPLLATFYPATQLDMIHSLLGMYIENDRLPTLEIHADESSVAGSPEAIVFADTFLKGVRDFDSEKAWEALKHQAVVKDGEKNSSCPSLREYEKYGYVPQDKNQDHDAAAQRQLACEASSAVPVTLEYALADWALAHMAEALGKDEDSDFFYQRSQNYKNLFDAESGFFRPRLKNGDWAAPLRLPGETNDGDYDPAWNYAFFAPHDIHGLVEQLGDQFITRLQTFFENNYFDMNNKAGMAYPFLFNYVKGEEWRTQKTVRAVIDTHFGVGPDGLPGTDDLGALSAWLVWAMMGLYPDCPAGNQYQLSTPFFERIEIDLDDAHYPGDSFIIETKNLSDDNIYIAAKKLNGKKMDSFMLNHNDLVNGGRLQITVKNKR